MMEENNYPYVHNYNNDEEPVITPQQAFTDIECICIDCGNLYIFSVGEQRMYQAKGLYPPKRCPTCRLLRKKKNDRQKEIKNFSNN